MESFGILSWNVCNMGGLLKSNTWIPLISSAAFPASVIQWLFQEMTSCV